MTARNIILFVIASLVGAGVAQANEPGEASFRVATYNIRYAAGADEKTGNGWNIRKGPLARLIRQHGFDIIGTQEGTDIQLGDLKNLLPEFDTVSSHYGDEDLLNSAILYRSAQFELIESGAFWLSQTPDQPSIGWDATDRRVSNWAKFREKYSGKEFYLFNLHFYYRYEIAKRESGPLMVRKIKEIAGDAPVVVTGDFNSRPDTPQIAAMEEIARDAYDITESERRGVEGTGFPGGVFHGEPAARIDYIFVTPQIRVLDYEVLSDQYNDGRYPSDHLPVTSFVAF